MVNVEGAARYSRANRMGEMALKRSTVIGQYKVGSTDRDGYLLGDGGSKSSRTRLFLNGGHSVDVG